MKNTIKMSLVAAVAVAGLTSNAAAQPLEEAIKNVDVSGSAVYRYDDRDRDDDVKDSSSNNYKVGVNLKSKVNEDVTAITRFIIGGADGGFASLDTTTDADNTNDQNVDVELSNIYFSYTGLANTTVNVGKQGLTTPWTVAQDADGNEQTGTGALALTTVGPVTFAAAYFNQTNLGMSADTTVKGSAAANGAKLTNVLTGDKNIITVAAIGNMGPVTLDAWYLDMQDSFDTFTVGAKASFDLDAVKLSVGARHTVLDFDDKLAGQALADEDNSLTKITLGAKTGIFGAKLNYGWTDEEGGLAALDNDAKTGMQGWTTNLNGVADATYLQVGVDAQVLDTLNLALNYHVLEEDVTDTKDTELYLQATYDMSKNLSTYVRFGQADLENEAANGDDVDRTIGRLQVQYSF